ncbi:hypothetical protein jhhlp_002025 [Lomentospora prolificans]|uniref:DUF4045 domain-containing protein n=1 Tax=Lomentospora prolificans TaxID=41688 RepID=A0A2N3NCU6_9PEZI|nr:hypothetical protein jhhlp_002025 [Lomentospora prolificans]
MSDDVSQFLQQVQQLQGRRAEEDEARSRELEEKILQEKSDRAARRAERARSISPQKSSPANTPPPPSHRGSIVSDGLSLTSSPVLESAISRRNDTFDNMESPMTNSSASPTRENESSFDGGSKRTSVTSSTTVPSPGIRSTPLSWQRRPNSQSFDKTKSRPLSMLAAENAARSSTTASSELSSATEQNYTKDEIAQALSSKDPTWFRQTPERGLNSAAFRRNQVEDEDRLDMSSMRSQLPGMTLPASRESPISNSPSLQPSKSNSQVDLTPTQRFEPPQSSVDAEIPSPERSPTRAEGRRSPTRPLSPTKGMGGFVQSAMMKRTDSIKRWSVASPPGLARADSVASNRNSVIDRAGVGSQPNSRSRPTSMIRDGSATPTPHPTSRHGSEELGNEPANTGSQGVADPAPDTKSNLTLTTTPLGQDEKTTPPSSPSKTMDTRRWSPTKSSWLEAALNKPETPKPKPAAPVSNQPAWMVELNKAKAQKANNPDAAINRLNSASHKHEVKIDGLLRSSPATTGPKTNTPALGSPLSTNLRSSVSTPSALGKPATGPEAPASDSVRRGSVLSVEGSEKPSTPTPVDFRSQLKPRQTPAAAVDSPKGGNVNELKNVFGNLRKTKTQNYVAPDELKDNILRGKAGLNITGGPKKTERKDEFKEAILKKKEEFKKAQLEGTGIATRPPGTSTTEQPIPEGLVKRNQLARSSTLSNRDSVSSDTTKAASSILSNRNSFATDITSVEAPTPSPPLKSSQTPAEEAAFETTTPKAETLPKSPPSQPASSQKEFTTPSRLSTRPGGNSLADRFNPALAGILARGPPPAVLGNKSSDNSSSAQNSGTAGSSSSSAGSGPQLTHITKNRARGPRRKAPTSAAPSASAPAARTSSDSTAAAPAPLSSPSSEPTPSIPDQMELADSSAMATPIAEMVSPAPTSPPDQIQLVDSSRSNSVGQIQLVDSSVMSPTYSQSYSSYSRRKENESVSSSSPGQIKLVDSSAMREAYAAATPTRERGGSVSGFSIGSATPTRDSRGSYSSFSSLKGALASQVAANAVQRSSPLTTNATVIEANEGSKAEPEEEAKPPPSSPKKLDVKRMSRFLDEANQSTPKTASTTDENPQRSPRRLSRPPSPVKPPEQQAPNQSPSSPTRAPQPSPTRPLPQPPSPTKETPTPLQRAPTGGPSRFVKGVAAMFGGGAASILPAKEPTVVSDGQEASPAPRSRSRSPTKLGNRPTPLSPGPVSPGPVASPMRSPTKQAIETAALLSDFFGPQRPKREYRADAAEILMRRPPTGQGITTSSVQRLQIFGDGKMVQIPAHNQRVLFEREMYVCSHVFTNPVGKKQCEVYFWAGDEVPPSTAKVAEGFASKEAKSVGGKMIVLKQGKETPEFLQAIGGVVITRRGSSNKYDSLASNMLCGRRHFGFVTFDEVDFSPVNLCSGFPYLINQQGQCFLWKGKGSDTEELESARLIGMDLSLTGQLEEIEDGNEPATFWDIFDGGSKQLSADHWRLKPNYSKYCCRLFCSDSSSKQQIIELSPYSQADLSPKSIYVLDAFFEMYIIVGAEAKTQYSSFRNALDFAQEYAILASGMEDRPFVPISTVVLEGIPRDLKSVFRKWRDADSPTITPPPATPGSGLKRARSLRIVPLTQALQALAE